MLDQRHKPLYDNFYFIWLQLFKLLMGGLCVSVWNLLKFNPAQWINGILGQLCAYIGWTGPEESLEDWGDECGLSPSTLRLGHRSSSQYWIFTIKWRRKLLYLWNFNARVGFEPAITKKAALTIATRPHPVIGRLNWLSEKDAGPPPHIAQKRMYISSLIFADNL